MLALSACACGGLELWWLYNAKRFQEVRPGVLYRTGQPTEQGMRYVIECESIRTVVTLQRFDAKMRTSGIDFGKPSGQAEADFTRHMKVRFEQWPLGDEMCWPWPAPWYLEEYLKLMDEPANWPVLIHCQGGRHRTGTLAAIFRLEYDRWPVERALEEMYSFNFGPAVPIQEHNLRTYFARPRPNAKELAALKSAFVPLLTDTAPADYEKLVLALRHYRDRERLRAAVEGYLASDGMFALPLAYRLIDASNDRLAAPTAEAAIRALGDPARSFNDTAIAAAIVADFGSPEQQEQLLALLTELTQGPVSQRYAALSAGVANRYTTNRLPFLKVLLDDERERLEPVAAGSRYCDTAVARMQAILDQPLFAPQDPTGWVGARTRAKEWFAAHSADVQFTQLQPPTGRKVVRAMQPGDEIERTQLR